MAERFSEHHPFTRTQVAEADEAVARESRSKRLLVEVTSGHRDMAKRNLIATHVAYWVVLLSLFAIERNHPSIDRHTLHVWLIVGIAGWIIRAVMYNGLFTVSITQMATSWALRLFPLILVSTTAAYWVWTAYLMVGSTLTVTTFCVFAGFTMMSIAIMGVWVTTPFAAGAYAVALWSALSIRLWQLNTVPVLVIGAMDATIFLTLWTYIYTAVRPMRPLLKRSDKADLLVADLEEANAKLSAMRNDSWETLERRSTFFAGASHDFVQRLHGMKLLALSTTADLPPGDRSRSHLGRLLEEVDSLHEYLTDVLDFARIEAGDQGAQIACVQIQKVFQRVALNFETVTESQGLDLKFRVTTLRVSTDAAMLQRILENLVSNALKFTRGRILVAARKVAGGVSIEVWDQGPGIDASHVSRVFEAFHQDAKQLPSRGARGVGLGLAVVKRFTDALGYSVTVKTQLNHGSTFRVFIPNVVAEPSLDTRLPSAVPSP